MNIRAFVAKVRRALFGGRRDRDVDDEIRFHLSDLSRFLFGITATDPPTYAAVTVDRGVAGGVLSAGTASGARRSDGGAAIGVTDFSSPPRVPAPLSVLS